MSRPSKCKSLEGLKMAYLNGMRYCDMEKEFGISHTTIAYWVRKWGLPRRWGHPPSDDVLLKEYVDNRLTGPEIADKYGCNQSMIHRHLVKLGVSRNCGEAREAFRQKILKETGLPYILDSQGYPRTRVPAAFQSVGRVNSGMVRLHDLEMEKHLGRAIEKGELVHHINFDKMDYRIENLHLCKSKSEHLLIHSSLRKVCAVFIKNGVIEFEGGRYVVNEEKLAEYLASIEHSEIPDPIPHFKDSE